MLVICAVLASINDPPATTSTVSVVEPTLSVTCTVRVLLSSTTTGDTEALLNPLAETVKRYPPTGKSFRRYWPAPSAFVVDFTPVARLSASIDAPATSAPLG